ncbi:hypothetical protein NML43_24835 [Rhodopseudomonas palustris]|uniref:hypothetical protein n=1 Tax=Rhodopseudomonas palustris TaxID=1076 RepID=UPI0020CE0637|nr:hypothetical protein [Rhodopseudomonas palustris]MCP9630332.1 hypothetical protein [Rhodopseudomonas palustris]
MASRALTSAAVMLLIGSAAAGMTSAQAQNLEAGKSPAQIFAGACSACHKSARGLLRTVPPGSLPSFLRQHYTTSSDMAGLLASYLISNGATDTRYKQNDTRTEPGQPEGRKSRRQRQGAEEAAPTEATAPAQAAAPTEEPPRRVRGKRKPKPEVEQPAEGAAVESSEPVAEAPPKQGRKHGRKEKPAQAAPAAAEPAKSDASKSDASKSEASKPEAAKPEAAKSEPPKAETAQPARPAAPAEPTRADPVPAVTPAPAQTSRTPEAGPPPAKPTEAPAPSAAGPSSSAPSIAVTPSAPPPASGAADAPISR